jgi:AcrR family transcriptional regulator
MKEKELMKISELSRRSGIPASTIRYYIFEGLIPPAMKTGMTRAYYSSDHLKALSLIRHKQVKEQKPLSMIKEEIRKEVSFPRRGIHQSDPSSNKRDAILASSTALFLQKGYAETSITDMAQHAKMSKETIYQHFRNKEEILMACADRIFRHMYDEVWGEIKGEKDMALRLFKRGKAFFATYPQWISMMNLVKSLSVGENPSFKEKFRQLLQQMVNPMIREINQLKQEGRIRKGIDSDMAGYILMGMIEYGAWLMTHEHYSQEEIVNSINSIVNEPMLKS